MSKLNLNPAQQTAVEHVTGSTLIIAGAGSGKTRVITARISHLLDQNLGDANSIIALTFTNKAAKEMQTRIMQITEGRFLIPFIGTFHAYCLSLLKKYGTHIGLENFTILDSDDQEKMLQDLFKRFAMNNKKGNPKQFTYQISQAKNSLAIGEESPLLEYDPTLASLLQAYENEKKHSKCLDFDDLIIKAVELLNLPTFRQLHQARVRHILVDEYQDTSVIQHRLLKLMGLNEKKLAVDSVCVVGDEDQSIYSWRGATVDNILQFPKEFPNVKIVKIEQNYRSADSILATANQLINHNQNRNPKHLWSERKAANRVLMLQTTSGYQEADLIAQTVKNQHQLKPDSTIATLYRTHFQSRIIEEALLKQSIPYKIVGGIQFYERKEIKDLLAYLKVILNPYDKVSFGRIYNCPPRKLGAQFAEQFFEAWAQEPFLNYMQISEKLIQSQALGNAQATNLTSLVKLLANFTAATAPAVAIQKIIELVGYTDYLKDGYATEEAQAKIDNIRELIRAAKHFEQEGLTTITQFIEEITLMQDKLSDQSQSTPHVQLMSLHAAKGLEFDTVIIAGLEEGLLPSTRSMNSSEQLEEERRLLYVGITRAREHLLLINAKSRSTYGQTSEQTPSRFAHEISGQVSQKLDGTYLNLFQVSDLISQFLKNQPLGKITPVSNAPTRSFSSSKPAPKLNSFTAYKPRTQETPSDSMSLNPTNWRINQPVQHAVFGVGLIQKIEPKATGSVLTIRFKIGVKKIDDKFIQKS